MTTALVFASLLALQDAAPSQDPTTQLDDVEVTAQRLEQKIQTFIAEVAAPSRGRGVARWARPVCVSATNFRPELGQYISQRITEVAADLGLPRASQTCTPNVVIIATQDGNELAQDMVRQNRRAFMAGAVGTDRGAQALDAFQNSTAPVRWWQQSLPVDARTGQRTVRLPGDSGAGEMKVVNESRLSTPILDNLVSTVVIVDLIRLNGADQVQLADYLAMVSLAQIDPDAELAGYNSILNLFHNPQGAAHLTDWDATYLEGLYDTRRGLLNRQAATNELSRAVRDARRRIEDVPD